MKIVSILIITFILSGCNSQSVEDDSPLPPLLEQPVEAQPENPKVELLPSYEISPTMLKLQTQPASISQVFTEVFQSQVEAEIASLPQASFDDPLLITDPYHTNAFSLYVQFTLPIEANISYYVSAAGAEEYHQHLGMFTEEKAAFSLYGLVAGKTNTIRVHMTDDEGQHISELSFQFTPSIASLQGFPAQLNAEHDAAFEKVSKGIFLLQGNNYVNNGFSFWIDADGHVRGQIKGLSDMWAFRKLDGYAYYNPDNKRIVQQDLLTGKIVRVYEHEGYSQHHDHIFLPNGNLVLLVTNDDDKYIEDHLIEIDLTSGQIVREVNLRDLLFDYPHHNNGNDWFHANSVTYSRNDGGSLFISGREVSTILKLSHYDSHPYVDWLINYEGRIWAGSEHNSKRLLESGNITPMLGQHTIELLNGEEDGVYQLYGFNNHHAMNRGGYDGHPISYDDVTDPNSSFLTIYTIDEEQGIYNESGSIQVQPKSNIRSSAQKYNSHYILSSLNIGMDPGSWYGRIDEYTPQGEKLLSIDVPDASYRAMKFISIQ